MPHVLYIHMYSCRKETEYLNSCTKLHSEIPVLVTQILHVLFMSNALQSFSVSLRQTAGFGRLAYQLALVLQVCGFILAFGL